MAPHEVVEAPEPRELPGQPAHVEQRHQRRQQLDRDREAGEAAHDLQPVGERGCGAQLLRDDAEQEGDDQRDEREQDQAEEHKTTP